MNNKVNLVKNIICVTCKSHLTPEFILDSHLLLEPTRGRGQGTGSGMSILVMVIIGCVPAAAIVLLAIFVTRAVFRARQKKGGRERKSSTASTLGEASVPAPDDDREGRPILLYMHSLYSICCACNTYWIHMHCVQSLILLSLI